MDNKSKDTINISIRFDTELLKKVDQDAKKELRSRSAQIQHMINQYYEMKKMINR